MKRLKQGCTIFFLLLILGLLQACSSRPNAITLIAKEYSYALPEEIPAGLTRITLKNEGSEAHHAQFARVNDDVTDEQILAALQQGPDTALALVTLPGGPAVVPPGQSTDVTINLTAGRYLIMCFVPGQDGVPHIAHGMLSMMRVVDEGGRAASEPKPDLTVTTRDFSFDLPKEISAGRQVWKVVNAGTQPHEVALIRLADGKTMDDVIAYMQQPEGAPPFEDAAGMQGLTPGTAGYVHLNLTPGNYVALCHIPDPASGKAHEELGMIAAFVVK